MVVTRYGDERFWRQDWSLSPEGFMPPMSMVYKTHEGVGNGLELYVGGRRAADQTEVLRGHDIAAKFCAAGTKAGKSDFDFWNLNVGGLELGVLVLSGLDRL